MLTFTADQIKNMSKDLLLLPDLVNAPQTGLVAQKAAYVAAGSNLLVTDDGEKVFSDAWESAVSGYHVELVELSSSQRTNYDNAKIDSAAQGDKSNTGHFPQSPLWMNLSPKLLDMNKGLPTTSLVAKTELTKSMDVQGLISILKNGFTNGTSTAFSGALVGSDLTVTGELLHVAPGDKLYMVINGTNTVIATVLTYNYVSDTTLGLTFNYGTPVDGSAACQTWLPGFTDSQRGGTATLVPYASVYALLRGLIQSSVSDWKTSLSNQDVALAANNDVLNGAHVSAALAAVVSAISAITTWQGLTDLVPNGLLTDNGLAPLESAITARGTQIPARITQIGTDLGSVSQNPDGSFSGSGAYYELFKVVDLRCAIGFGTLTAYYDNLKNQKVFDKAIAKDNAQIAQYGGVMYVSKLLANTVSGQDTFTVDTVAGLAVSDTVIVMDNLSINYSRTISQIVGTSVKINSGIPTVLTKDALARIVKMK